MDSAFADLPKTPKIQWLKYHTLLNYYTNYGNDTARSHRYIDSMASVLQANGTSYSHEQSQTILAYATLWQAEQRYSSAFAQLYNGSLLARAQHDYCGLADLYNRMGVIRYEQEQYKAAIPFLREALRQSGRCTQDADFNYGFILPQSLLNTLALSFEKTGQQDSAGYYYHKALQFIAKRQHLFPGREPFIRSAAGVIKANLGGLYMQLGKDSLAMKLLHEDIAINDREGFAIEDAQTAKLKLAALYIRHGQLTPARVLLEQLQKDLTSKRGKSIMNAEVYCRWLQNRAALAASEHKMDTAYRYLSVYHLTEDSLDRSRSKLIRADLDQAFVLNEQQRYIAVIGRNDRLKTWLLTVVALLLAGALLAARFARKHLKTSRATVKLMSGANQRLEYSLNELEKSREDNRHSLKIVAHDLRNPLGAIASGTTLLLESKVLPDEDREVLKLIQDCSNSSIHLVSELLEKNNSRVLNKTLCSMNELLEDVSDQMQYRVKEKEQQLVLSADPAELFIDADKMHRVLSNLLSNAIKFSPHRTRVDIVGKVSGGNYVIEVRDQGMGIPESIRPDIFTFFTTAQRTGTDGEQSHGMGLAICKQIIEDHAGQIGVTGQAGPGSVFFIILPLPDTMRMEKSERTLLQK